MNYRALGASGLLVPAIGLATTNFLGRSAAVTGIGDRIASKLIDIAMERGAGFIDTHASDPETRALLGKIIGKRRSKLLIAVSVGSGMGSGPHDRGASRHNLIRTCEQTLQQLDTDYLDLLQIDRFDPQTPLDETLSTLASLIQSGKVRYIGCANFAGWQLMKALAVSDRLGLPRFVANQFTYSLAARDCEMELLPLGADQNVGSLARGGLAGGLLAGNFGRSSHPPAITAIIDCLGDVSRETGASDAQISLAWLLHQPTIAAVLLRASCVEQLEASLDAITLRLTGDQLARLDVISDRAVPYQFADQPHDGERLSRQPDVVPNALTQPVRMQPSLELS
jgi:aryl-alcohol dehydrogenase-like predicted oxidoreductase